MEPRSSETGYAHNAAGAPRSHTAHVVREIGQGIVSGHYRQGLVLPGDAELQQRFGVSRTVLREAMRVLAGKGLVQAKARIGTSVRDRADWNLFDRDVLLWYAQAGFDTDFLVHLSEMRRALEPEAAALAAQRRTPAQLAELFGHVERMGAAGDSPADFVDADLKFHLLVSVAAANPFMYSIAALIEVALVGLLTISSPTHDPVRVAQSIARHRAIAEAISRGDPEAARVAMQSVIEEGVLRARARSEA